VVGLYDVREGKTVESSPIKKLVSMFEKVFVKPFVPATLGGFVFNIFFVWFFATIPIVIHRYYEKEWAQFLWALHGPFNFFSTAVGCKGFDLKALIYTEKLDDFPSPNNDAMEHDKEVDWTFTVHALCAITWLTMGFLQIFTLINGWSVSAPTH